MVTSGLRLMLCPTDDKFIVSSDSTSHFVAKFYTPVLNTNKGCALTNVLADCTATQYDWPLA